MSADPLNAQLLRHLDCPVCFETCTPPIYICRNGHRVCSKCQPRIFECGTCRAPGRPTLRCVTLENIAEMLETPCPNQSRGCDANLKIGELANHLTKCGFSCHVCTEWKMFANEIAEHVRQKHPSRYYIIAPSGVKYMRTCTPVKKRCHDRSRGNYILFAFNGDFFWMETKYNSATQIYTKNLRVVSHEAEDAGRYCYRVEFKSEEDEVKYDVCTNANVPTESADAGEGMGIFLPARFIEANENNGWLSYNLKITLN